MEEKFILPEKWCIKVTEENEKIVGEYFSIVSLTYSSWWANATRFEMGEYLRSHNQEQKKVSNKASSSFSSTKPEGIELTK